MIYITRCVCPSGHCLAECAWDDTTHTIFGSQVITERVLTSNDLHACPLCDAPRQTWSYQHAPSDYPTLHLAVESLRERALMYLAEASFLHARSEWIRQHAH